MVFLPLFYHSLALGVKKANFSALLPGYCYFLISRTGSQNMNVYFYQECLGDFDSGN